MRLRRIEEFHSDPGPSEQPALYRTLIVASSEAGALSAGEDESP